MRALRPLINLGALRRLRDIAVRRRNATLTVVLVVASLGLSIPFGHAASAAAPSDYLCYVEGNAQSTTVGTTFSVPLEVEISSSACGAPTPDTATTNSVTFSVLTAAGGPSASLSPSATVVASSGESSVVATANYAAGSFEVVATSASTSSNTTTQSVVFALTNATLVPASILAGLAEFQETPLDTTFALAFSTTVDDTSGNPVAGVPVTFAAPTSGASGTFAATAATNVTVFTDAAGVAVAPEFTANATPGGYVVTARVTGLSQDVAFALVNEIATNASVTTVSPSRIVQGAKNVELTVSGSGFESGATVTFGNAGITVQSVKFQSSTSLLVTVSVATSGVSGLIDVMVTNPGEEAVTGEFILNVAPLVAARPATITVLFPKSDTDLSADQQSRLASLAHELVRGAAVRIVGYATSSQLAASRDQSVLRFLRARTRGVHVTEVDYISPKVSVVKVITTAN